MDKLTEEQVKIALERYLKQKEYSKCYYKQYQKDNKEKIKVYNLMKYHENKEKICLQKKEYYKRKKREKEEELKKIKEQ